MAGNFSENGKLNLKLSDLSYGTLRAIKGEEHFSKLFCYRLQLTTNNKAITKEALCNKPISFTMEAVIDKVPKVERFFNGVIDKVIFKKIYSPDSSAVPEIEYYLQVLPKLASLTKVSHSRVFFKQKQTVVDVIEKLLKEHSVEYKLDIKNPKLFIAESCVQYNETDYNFFCRLLQEAGYGYFFKHEKDKHTVIITDKTSSYFEIADKLVTYVDDQGHRGRLSEVSYRYGAHVCDFTVNAFSYTKPKEVASKKYTNPIHKNQQEPKLKYEESVYFDDLSDLTQLSELAQNLGTSQQLPSVEIVGTSRYASFAVGGTFKLNGKFFDSMGGEKDYVISALKFEAHDGEFLPYSNSFSAIPKSLVAAPYQTVDKPIITGLHLATVVNKEGKAESQEPYCDDNGMVYIKFLWGDKDTLCRAHVLSATNSYTLPRIGSLAYVTFPNNNLYNDIPVIVGISNQGLIDFKKKEEWYNNIYKTYRATSDNELYNFLAFKDQKDQQEVKLHARKDMVVEVLNDQTTTIKKIRKVTIEEGNDLLDVNKGDIIIKVAEGKYNFYCKGQMMIKSDADIEIEAKNNFTMKSGGKFTIEAKGDLSMSTKGECKLDATSDVTVNSSKNLTNKAAMAASYQSGTATNIKANTQIGIDATMTEVKGKANLKLSSPLTKIGM